MKVEVVTPQKVRPGQVEGQGGAGPQAPVSPPDVDYSVELQQMQNDALAKALERVNAGGGLLSTLGVLPTASSAPLGWTASCK